MWQFLNEPGFQAQHTPCGKMTDCTYSASTELGDTYVEIWVDFGIYDGFSNCS